MPQPTPHQPGQRRSLADAAIHLGISPKTIYRRIREGKIRSIQDGRRVFISDAECRRLSGDTVNTTTGGGN